ncbi:MAG: ubiquitin-like domain-containing protein [Candidatus Saccharibacteria bacterium]|nr:ubiquitin-like domain-containing protein [Candidatus Saccharibacteria bacterium]
MKKTLKKLRSKKTQKRVKYLSRHPFVVPVTTFVVMFFFTLVLVVIMGGRTIGASDTRVVQLYVDGRSQVVPTRASTVEELLQRLDIEVGQRDIVEPGLDAEITDDNFQVNVYKARSVLIEDEGKRSVIVTAAPSPRAVVKAADLEVHPEDRVEKQPLPEQDPADIIKEGGVQERIVIERATPVALNIFGTQVDVRTHAETVGDLLAERDLHNVSVLPEERTPITSDLSIFVTEPGKKLRVVQEEIPFEEETRENPSLEFGEERVEQEGSPGRRAVVYEIAKDGTEEVFNKVVVRKPVKRIVVRGKRLADIFVSAESRELMAAAGIAETDFEHVKYIVNHESGPNWNVTARNVSSGAYGLCQSLPGSKMASAGADWRTNPVTQLRWCNSYALSNYGSWSEARFFHQGAGWW